GGENLKIHVNAGRTINLIAGPKDLDALSRLGIDPRVVTAPATGSSSTTPAPQKGVTPTYGLGLTGGITGPLDISTKSGANMARSTLLAVLSNIQSTYQKTNAPPPAAALPGHHGGSANATTTSQLANYSLALKLMKNDPRTAVATTQAIVQNGGRSKDGGLPSLLGALGGLG